MSAERRRSVRYIHSSIVATSRGATWWPGPRWRRAEIASSAGIIR